MYTVSGGVYVTIGDNIRRTRQEKGLSQEELAQAIGATKSAISRYEAGKRQPSYDQLESLADALDVPLEVLLGIGDSVKTELWLEEEQDQQNPKDSLRAVVCAIPSRFHNEIFQKLIEIGISMEKIVRESKRGAFIGEGFIVDELTPEEQIRVSNAINEVIFRDMPHQAPDETTTAPQSTPAPPEGKDTAKPSDAPETPPEGE